MVSFKKIKKFIESELITIVRVLRNLRKSEFIVFGELKDKNMKYHSGHHCAKERQ